jgi:WD40 repeat protein/tetratricopeptide (TPR) repeat protein
MHQYRRLIFSPDSEMLVIVDDQIRWLSAVSGHVIGSIPREWDRLNSLALSADGLTLAYVGYSEQRQLFSIFNLDAATRTVTPWAKDAVGTGTLSASALSPNGNWIALGEQLSGPLSVYDTATGRTMVKHNSAHASPIAAIAVSGDGQKLATADIEGTIKIWPDAQKLTSTSTALLTLKGHQGSITSVRFSSDGKRLVSTSADKTARVWDLANAGTAIRPVERSGVNCLVAQFSPDGQLIAAADGGSARLPDGLLIAADAADGARPPDGQPVAAADGGSVRLWDAATGRLVRKLSTDDKKSVRSIAFSPTDGNLLAVGHGGNAEASFVALWDIHAGTELARLTGAKDLPGFWVNGFATAISALAFSPDGKYLVAGFGTKMLLNRGPPSPLKVWDVAKRRLVHRLYGHTGDCGSLDFSKDGKLLASCSRNGTAIIWSTETWSAKQTLENPDADASFTGSSPQSKRPGMFEGVAFSPDGKILALASREGTVQLWDIAAGKFLLPLKGHSGAVQTVAFSPDGRTLASGGADQTVRLWNCETWRELMQLDPGGIELGSVLTVAFSPGGKQLLTGGEDGPAAFWSAAPSAWNDPDQAAEKLRLLLKSNADFQSRIRMLSENLRLHEALAKLDSNEMRVQAALAATQANWHASRHQWSEAVAAFDRLVAADPTKPEAWLRTPGLLRLATSLLHRNRPEVAATLLQGGAKRRIEDGLTPISKGHVDEATGDLLLPLLSEVEKRLAKETRDVGLLELRAEVAGQESDFAGQAAYYTTAIKILTPSPLSPGPGESGRGEGAAGTMSARLRSLYRRRGDAYAALQKWSEAVGDYDHVITPDTTDAVLLSNRARAQGALGNWDGAATDWSRAATGSREGAKLLAQFARRLVAAGQVSLAKGHYEKARVLYERSLEAAPESELLAAELAQLLLDKDEEWITLKPTEMKSEGGATLTLKEDGSVMASGKNPDRDSYTLTCTTSLESISAIRLEVLPDPSLPYGGSGRHWRNGDFALSEWKVTAEPRTPGEAPRLIGWKDAWSDFSLEAFEVGGPSHISSAIDGNSRTFWNTWPKVGLPHWAIFRPEKPIGRAGSNKLKFMLEFKSGMPPQYNLGRFRLSVSANPGVFDWKPDRFAAMAQTDPWTKLAAVYHLVGDRQAQGRLLKLHPGAAVGIGDLYAAGRDWERAIAEYRKAITGTIVDDSLLAKLVTAYGSAGRVREAVQQLTTLSSANPQDTKLFMRVAVLQAWLGQDGELADTRSRGLALAKNTTDPFTAERVAMGCCVVPLTDKSQREAMLTLAKKAVELGKASPSFPYFQMALGMAEYRSGNYAAADEALEAATRTGPNHPGVTGTSAFYRAMSQFRQGSKDEARKHAVSAAVKMKPLPKDNNPLAGGVITEADLILWLAYKEAKAMIQFDAAVPQTVGSGKK